MFRFENLAAFQWLWLVVILVALTILRDRQAARVLQNQMGAKLAPFLTKSLSLKKRKTKRLFEYLTLFLMIAGLARPQWGDSKQEVKAEGVEMIIMIDVSDSMLAEDVKPSRLEQAKAELSRLVDLMPGNKMGIIAFAGNAGLISPLTTDPAAIKMYIESLSTQSVSTQGTNFEEALRVAEKAYQRGGIETDDTVKVTRVILIASDGENHEEGALKAAEGLLKQGVRIFTLAYGTEKGGAIPVRDNTGYVKNYKKDSQGNTVLTTVKGDALKELAKRGEGSFYFANFGGDHISRLAEDISKLEKQQFDSTVAVQYEERFQWPLFLAFFFGVIEVVLGERQKKFRLWRGRFEVPTA